MTGVCSIVRGLLLLALIACGSDPERTAPVKIPPKSPVAAIGDTSQLPPALQRAFSPEHHEVTPKPRRGDWLEAHPTTPQTFDDYVAGKPTRPTSERRVLYLLPIGEFPATAPSIPALVEIVGAFYTLEVKVLPAVKLDAVVDEVTSRVHRGTDKLQLLAGDVLTWLTQRVPDDAFGVVGITMVDLYPDPKWNFVFGMASLRDRVAIQSFARHDPAFFDEPRGAGWELLALRRASWTLVHETAHMFSMMHCVHFRCVVAGSNHQEEADRSPLHPCPVCLRKLHHAIGFDPEVREVTLANVLRKHGITDEAAWAERRASWIRDGRRQVN